MARGLTRAQHSLLERLAKPGAVLHYIGGIRPSWFVDTNRQIDYRTCHRLRALGFIEPYIPTKLSMDPNYRITPAGRAHLRKPKAT